MLAATAGAAAGVGSAGGGRGAGTGRGRGRGRGRGGAATASSASSAVAVPSAAVLVPASVRVKAGRGGGAAGSTVSSAAPRAARLSAAAAALPSTATLAERMAAELREESLDCTICLEPVRRSDGVWACDTCFRVLHFACIRTWRTKSGASAGSDAWRCPACACEQRQFAAQARCFCGKMREPEAEAASAAGALGAPHACGQVCGKRRLGRAAAAAGAAPCPHPCSLPCHPGPCPPCGAMGEVRQCGCRRTSFRLRCGAAPDASQACCGRPCGRPLACGVAAHRCEALCHADGACAPCARSVLQACYCGAAAQARRCGSGARAPRSRYLAVGDALAAGPCAEVAFPLDADGVATMPVAYPLQPALFSVSAGVSAGTRSETDAALLAVLSALAAADCEATGGELGPAEARAAAMAAACAATNRWRQQWWRRRRRRRHRRRWRRRC